MLKLRFAKIGELCQMEKFIWNPSAVFNYMYDELQDASEWLQDPFVRSAIERVDGINLGATTLYSLLENNLRPADLSTGCKNLILCKFLPDGMHRLSCMGENCYPLLFELAKLQDVTVGVSIPINLTREFFETNSFLVLNTNAVISTWDDWCSIRGGLPWM